jgi:hypothetical protein
MPRRKSNQVCKFVYPLVSASQDGFVPTIAMSKDPSPNEIHAKLNEAVLLGRKQQPRRIPAEHRTIPMTLKTAAKLMGFVDHRSVKDAVELLSKTIKDGTIVAEKQTRQRYVFNREDFPTESHPEITPSKP